MTCNRDLSQTGYSSWMEGETKQNENPDRQQS